jgi:hypothetical protein
MRFPSTVLKQTNVEFLEVFPTVQVGRGDRYEIDVIGHNSGKRVATGDPRCIETAGLIRDRYLAGLEREA